MFDFQPFSVHFSSCKDRIDPLFDFNLPQTSCITYAQNICHGLFNRGVNRAIWPCYNSLPSNKSSPFSIKRVLCVDLLFILTIRLKQRMCLWEICVFFFRITHLLGMEQQNPSVITKVYFEQRKVSIYRLFYHLRAK